MPSDVCICVKGYAVCDACRAANYPLYEEDNDFELGAACDLNDTECEACQ